MASRRPLTVTRPKLSFSRSHSNPIRKQLGDQDLHRTRSLDRDASYSLPAQWRWQEPDGFGGDKKVKSFPRTPAPAPSLNSPRGAAVDSPDPHRPSPAAPATGKRFTGFGREHTPPPAPVSPTAEPPVDWCNAKLFLGACSSQTWSRCPRDLDDKVQSIPY